MPEGGCSHLPDPRSHLPDPTSQKGDAPKMDLALILGLLFALVSVIVGMILTKANFQSYVSIDSFIIVFGGTVGATVAGLSMKQALSIFKIVIDTVKPPKMEWDNMIAQFVELATAARREGVIFLQDKIETQENDLMRSGLQLIVDGADSDVLMMVVGTKVSQLKSDDKVGMEIFATMAGYAPSFGLLGTVLGLIMVLGNLSEPEKLGMGIAQAFLTTLYGIIFAGLVFTPLSQKIRANNKEKSRYYDMLMTGLESIHEGDNPLLLEEKLKAFKPMENKKKAKPDVAGTEAEGGEGYGQGDLQTEAS